MTGHPPSRPTPRPWRPLALLRPWAWRLDPDGRALLRLFGAVAVIIAAIASVTAAWGQPCDATELPSAGAAADPALRAATGGAKFRLIAQQCPALATSTVGVERAAQLDLYDRGPVAVPMAMEPADRPAGAGPVFDGPVTLPANRPARRAGRLDAAAERRAGRIVSLTPALTEAALAHRLDPLLLQAIAHVESRHRPDAVSRAGARGLMQVMPPTGERFGVGRADELFDARANARAAAAYLATLRARYRGDLRLMLAAYNAGEGAVERHRGVPPYPETQAYVRQVMAVHQRLASRFIVTRSGALVERAGGRTDDGWVDDASAPVSSPAEARLAGRTAP